MPRRFSSALAIVSILGSVPLSTSVSAQTCEQELARQDAALRQLDADARREGVDFLLDDVRHAALGEVSKRLRGDATADALRDINARWQEYEGYVTQGRTFQAVAESLYACLTAGKTGCLAQIKEGVRRDTEATRLSARIGEAVQKWIDSLGNEAISRVAERVDRVRNFMANFTSRSAGTATQAATQGIDSCLRDFDRRVRQTQNNSSPVEPRQPPSVSQPPKNGMSAGTIAALGLGAAGALTAVVVGVNATNEANNAAGPGTSSTEPSQIRLVSGGPIRCNRVGGASLQSMCLGDIILDVGSVFGPGSQVCIRTDPSAFFTCTSRGSSSTMTFSISERIINVDFNGNITGCRPVQTGIFVYNGPNTGTPTARVSGNISVTCN